jgi:hypothetical protein
VARFVKHYLDNAERYAVAADYVGPAEEDKAANAARYAELVAQRGESVST